MKIILATFMLLFTTSLMSNVINTINYKGMNQISDGVALRMLNFEKGDEVDEKMIDEAIKKYFKQGYFTDIYAEIDGDVLTFNFTEKPVISQIELKGYKENDKDIIDTVIQIKKGSLYNEKKLESAKKRIMDAISQDGKIDSVVEIQKEYLDNGSLKVIFVVNEGEEIIIEKLNYHGVAGLDSDDFDEVISNKEHEFMGWFWGRNNGEMDLNNLEYDPLRIRDYYMQFGYLDAKVNKPFVRVNFNHYTADINYQIEEGSVYTISAISFEQVTHVIDEEKIKEVIKLEVGEPFNIKTFRSDSDKIKTLIADLSYAFTQVVPDLKKDKEKNTVEVVFKIIPGDKVKIRDVVISGNNRTLDRIVRRELYLGPGDMYSLTDLKDSRNALGRLGFFEGNTIEEKRISQNSMDLIVKVKEAPTGNVQLGGGYGSYGGIMLTVGVNDRNIWGSGINIGLQGELSQTNNSASFNISNSRMNDSDFSGNFAINYSNNEYNDYSVKSVGFSVGSGYRFTRHISGYLGYNLSDNTYSDINYDTNDTYYRELYDFESYSKSSVTVSVKYDDTDDYYLPREGLTLSQSIEKSGIGGDAEFMKFRTDFAKYKGLDEYIGFDAILRYKARFYYLIDDGYIPTAEKFYMGGMRSVRGYESYSLAPKLPADSTGYERTLGGEKTFSNNIELSLPLIPKAKMRFLAFADWGTIGDSNIDEISRGGYGGGIEWFSPVGPIQLVFAKPLGEEEGDRTSNFEFSMGQRF
ncbi:MAG: outer membrane protein assembly factor BamA [Campylobacterota bacterium]|nr:outer membrane protein assembly factor BamA [Campylobacterota bacterium]